MKRWFTFLAVLTISGAAMLAGGRAQATCCRSTADCPAGFACIGGACDASATECTCDADCGPNLHCQVTGVTICVQPAGGAQQCHLHNQCLAPWQGSCATDVDCGPGGFTCAMNGSLCSATGCQPTTMCRDPMLPTTCDTDADCPAAWTCEPDTDVSTSCIRDLRHCPAQGCPAPTGAKICRPPMFALVGGSLFIGGPAAGNICTGAGGESAGGALGGGDGGGMSGEQAAAGGGPGAVPGMGGAQAAAGGGPGDAGSGAHSPGTGCRLVSGAPENAPLPLLLAVCAISIRRIMRRR